MTNSIPSIVLRGLPVLGLWLSLAGCHASFTSKAPRGFAELEEDGAYAFRAASPEGLVMAVREIDHEPEASRSFWAAAVENAMRQRGGYALLEKRELAVAAGRPATQLRFGHDEGNRPHLYWVTVVVTPDAIYLLEAGGERPLFEQHAPEIERWIASFSAESCAPFPLAFACTQHGGKGVAER